MELIVVIVIISLMLVFAVPEFSWKIMRDDTEIAVNRIVHNIQELKIQAPVQNRDLYMCFQTAANTISMGEHTLEENTEETWKEITWEKQALDSENTTEYPTIEFPLPDNIRIDHVAFSDKKTDPGSEPCILFYKNGYCDWAVIHLSHMDGRDFSLMVQPFLHKIQTYEGHVPLDHVR
jgi:Tfp pilus assembly protein FimT